MHCVPHPFCFRVSVAPITMRRPFFPPPLVPPFLLPHPHPITLRSVDPPLTQTCNCQVASPNVMPASVAQRRLAGRGRLGATSMGGGCFGDSPKLLTLHLVLGDCTKGCRINQDCHLAGSGVHFTHGANNRFKRQSGGCLPFGQDAPLPCRCLHGHHQRRPELACAWAVAAAVEPPQLPPADSAEATAEACARDAPPVADA